MRPSALAGDRRGSSARHVPAYARALARDLARRVRERHP
jgi:hypothetical protein